MVFALASAIDLSQDEVMRLAIALFLLVATACGGGSEPPNETARPAKGSADHCYSQMAEAVRTIHVMIETGTDVIADPYEHPLSEVDTEGISRRCLDEVYMPTVNAENAYGSDKVVRATELIDQAVENLEEISGQPIL